MHNTTRWLIRVLMVFVVLASVLFTIGTPALAQTKPPSPPTESPPTSTNTPRPVPTHTPTSTNTPTQPPTSTSAPTQTSTPTDTPTRPPTSTDTPVSAHVLTATHVSTSVPTPNPTPTDPAVFPAIIRPPDIDLSDLPSWLIPALATGVVIVISAG